MAFQFGTTGGHLLPLSGDWYASGTTTLGLYDPSTSLFSLRCSNCSGFADTTFQYGPAGRVGYRLSATGRAREALMLCPKLPR